MDTDTAADWSSGGTHTTRADGGTPGCWDVLADRSRTGRTPPPFPPGRVMGAEGDWQILIAVPMMPRMKNNSSYGSGESFAQGEC